MWSVSIKSYLIICLFILHFTLTYHIWYIYIWHFVKKHIWYFKCKCIKCGSYKVSNVSNVCVKCVAAGKKSPEQRISVSGLAGVRAQPEMKLHFSKSTLLKNTLLTNAISLPIWPSWCQIGRECVRFASIKTSSKYFIFIQNYKTTSFLSQTWNYKKAVITLCDSFCW